MAWIVSDIDGTLLDDSETCPLPSALLANVIGRHHVVFASSRTVAEINTFARHLGWPSMPCIAEDGQVVRYADGASTILGIPAALLRERLALHGLAERVESLAAHTPPDRIASLLIPVVRVPEIREGVTRAGLRVTLGGRWATITGVEWNKGSAAQRLLATLGVTQWVAIGNAANDASLLRAATWRFVIRNANGGHDPGLVGIPDAVLLDTPGPLGWGEMLERLPATAMLTPEPEDHDATSHLDHHRPHDPRT